MSDKIVDGKQKFRINQNVVIFLVLLYIISTLSVACAKLVLGLKDGVFNVFISQSLNIVIWFACIILTLLAIVILSKIDLRVKFVVFICMLLTLLEDYVKQWQPWSFFVISILIIICCSVAYYYLEKDWRDPPWWSLFTFVLMLLTFVCGILILDGSYGYHETKLSLNENGNPLNKFGFVECNSSMNRIYVGSKVSCKTTEYINLTMLNITLITSKDHRELDLLSLNQFTAPGQLVSIEFEVQGYDSKGNFHNLTTYSEFSYYSYEKSKERENTLLIYILALIGIIAFSIPSMMKEFRELMKKEEPSNLEELQKELDDERKIIRVDLEDKTEKAKKTILKKEVDSMKKIQSRLEYSQNQLKKQHAIIEKSLDEQEKAIKKSVNQQEQSRKEAIIEQEVKTLKEILNKKNQYLLNNKTLRFEKIQKEADKNENNKD
jgi:hypothetical protein